MKRLKTIALLSFFALAAAATPVPPEPSRDCAAELVRYNEYGYPEGLAELEESRRWRRDPPCPPPWLEQDENGYLLYGDGTCNDIED